MQLLIEETDLRRRVAELADQISHECPDGLCVIGVLNGAFVFVADLLRQLTLRNVECDFIKVSSYGRNSESSGEIEVELVPSIDLNGRHVLVVEDIVDTGLTASWLIDYMMRRKAASARLCALLNNPTRRRTEVELDYIGFEVKTANFVVGYGIDHADRFRNLPYIAEML